MTKHELAKYFRTQLRFEWGGGKHYADELINENGLLLLAYQFVLQYDAGELEQQDADTFLMAIELCTPYINGVKYKGVERRDPNSGQINSMDNDIGVCAIGVFLNKFYIEENKLKFGKDHNWFFNDQNPDRHILESLRQGGDIAFYQICALKDPDWLLYLWLLFGIAFKLGGLLTWLRLRSVQRLIDNKYIAMSGLKIFLFYIANAIWAIRWTLDGQTVEKMMRSYFPKEPAYGDMAA
jgi:hypothetical protein